MSRWTFPSARWSGGVRQKENGSYFLSIHDCFHNNADLLPWLKLKEVQVNFVPSVGYFLQWSWRSGFGIRAQPAARHHVLLCFFCTALSMLPTSAVQRGGTGIDQSLSDCRCVTHWARFDAAGDHQRCSLQELSRSRWVCLLAFFQQIRGFKTYVFTVWTRSVAISGFYYKIIFTKTIDSNDIITLSIEKNNNNAFSQIHLCLCSMSTDCLNLTDFY